jgi:N-formylglutamate amidohydrolase
MNKNYIEFEHHRVINENFTELWLAKKPSRVVISVPHDGIPNYKWPDKRRDRRSAVTGGDPGVWFIAKDILFGARQLNVRKVVSVIKGNIPRGMVDLNRSWPIPRSYYSRQRPQLALENRRYASVYRHYHNSIRDLLTQSVERYGRDGSLLVDLHGFGTQPNYAPEKGYDLILGTGNRVTIYYDDIDLAMGEFMRNKGYEVFIPGEERANHKKEDKYAAEFITRHYSQKFKINAIQIETAHKFRDKKEGVKIGPRLSRDLASFFEEFYGQT